MTFKQVMRKLLSYLWLHCAELGKAKMGQCYADKTELIEWWEAFIERCDKRALHHAEFVPREEPSRGGDPQP